MARRVFRPEASQTTSNSKESMARVTVEEDKAVNLGQVAKAATSAKI
jgi:hypothetical protein